MAWKTIKNTSGRGREPFEGVRIARTPKGGKKGTPRGDSVRIRIGAKLCEKYRLLVGDRVYPSFDYEDGLGRVTRTTAADGYAASSGGAKSDGSKFTQVVVSFSLPDDEMRLVFPNNEKMYVSGSVGVTPDGIVFALARKQE
ncbi:MAG: hypothetical protein WC114_02755 [Smithellaceae bacterium]|jgi:hypothetical protein